MTMADHDDPQARPPLRAADDLALDAFFDDARAGQMVLPDALTARILADAADLSAQRLSAQRSGLATQRRTGWFAGLGGWPSLAALSTAALAGLWIGYSPPSGLDGIAPGFVVTESATVDLFNVMESYDDLFAAEG